MLALALACAAASAATAGSRRTPDPEVAAPRFVEGRGPARAADGSLLASSARRLDYRIVAFRESAWRWQRLMGRRPTRSNYRSHSGASLEYRRWVLSLWQHRSRRLHTDAKKWMVRKIQNYRDTVEHWSSVMGAPRPRVIRTLANVNIEGQFVKWRRLSREVLWQAANPPHLREFMCIHSHEGSWTDTGAPYYGGIQFGYSEWRTYGYPYTGKEYAYQASPLEQIWAGERYWRVSGFHPWPNTARMCRLL